MRDGRDLAVVGLLHRVGEVVGWTHYNTRLSMELVVQVHNGGRQRRERLSNSIELVVVHIVRWAQAGGNTRHLHFLSGHTQIDRVLRHERLVPELVAHQHRPRRPHFRGQEVVHFEVRVYGW